VFPREVKGAAFAWRGTNEMSRWEGEEKKEWVSPKERVGEFIDISFS